MVELGNDTAVCLGEQLVFDAGENFSSYLWNQSLNNRFLTTDTAGTYHLTVSNEFNCYSSDSVRLTLNMLPQPQLGNDTSICYGDRIELRVNDLFKSYVWQNGLTGPVLTTDTAGVFVVQVSNMFNCKARDSIVVTMNPIPSVKLGNDTVICRGSSIQFDAGSGFSSYVWQNFTTNQTFTADKEGRYWVRVTNNTNCWATDTVYLQINELPEIDSIQTSNVMCFGNANGSISVFAKSDNKYLFYSIDNGNTFLNNKGRFAELDTGKYKVLITDVFNCSITTQNIVITQPDPLLMLANHKDLTSYYSNDGTITMQAFGGTQAYEFFIYKDSLWHKFNGNAVALESGTYPLLIEDANACTRDTTIIVTHPPAIVIHAIYAGNISCFGQNDGQIEIVATGGTGKLFYSIDSAKTFSDNKGRFSLLKPGTYQIAVKDVNNTILYGDTAVVQEPEQLKINQVITQKTSCRNVDDGEIEVLASGGTGNYKYQLNDTIVQYISLFSGLKGDNYKIKVSDENDCSQTAYTKVMISEELCIEIPEMFSPNGDGYNDTWQLKYIELYPNAIIKLYDRWSKVVYESTDDYKDWDGTSNGAVLPVDSYFYVIYLDESIPPVKGYVTIIK